MSVRKHVVLSEDLSKNDVEGIISNRLSSYGKSTEFQRAVRDIAADVIEDLYRTLWNRSSSWKGGIKK